MNLYTFENACDLLELPQADVYKILAGIEGALYARNPGNQLLVSEAALLNFRKFRKMRSAGVPIPVSPNRAPSYKVEKPRLVTPKMAVGLLPFTVFRNEPYSGETGIADTPEILRKMLVLGNFRHWGRARDYSQQYAYEDLVDMESWASPAELSFKKGTMYLHELLEIQRKKPLAEPEEDLVAVLEPELVQKPAPPKQAPADALQIPEAYRVKATPEASGSALFWFENHRSMLPSPNRPMAYLMMLPDGAVQKALHAAHLWFVLLREERTGYLRACGTWSQQEYEKRFKEHEELIYKHRRAWENGIFRPLLPGTFQFLF